MSRVAWSLVLPFCLSLAGCDFGAVKPEEGASSFEVTGQAFYTGAVLPPVKMALFYTGDYLYADHQTFPSGTTAALASNVVSLGQKTETETPFTLDVDLDGYTGTNATATLLMWVDLDSNDALDVGEKTSRVLPNIDKGCPVFGAADSTVPVHYIYDAAGDGLSGIAKGWNQSKSAWYVPAKDVAGADIENEQNFSPIP